jgi:hypothetical protein
MPWKNGLGVTAEIAVFPEGADLSNFQWRISSAKVTSDNHFSNFEGYDRILTVLKGEGLKLNSHSLKPFEIFKFKGEEEISCSLLGGAVEDLGIIYNRELYSCEMSFLEISHETELRLAGDANFLYSVSSNISVGGVQIEAGDALKIDGNQVCEVKSKSWPVKFFQIRISKR